MKWFNDLSQNKKFLVSKKFYPQYNFLKKKNYELFNWLLIQKIDKIEFLMKLYFTRVMKICLPITL